MQHEPAVLLNSYKTTCCKINSFYT